MRRKTTGFYTITKDASGSLEHHEFHEKFETAVDSVHATGSRMLAGKRPWQQPQAFVREEFSDGSTDLVYYEFFVK